MSILVCTSKSENKKETVIGLLSPMSEEKNNNKNYDSSMRAWLVFLEIDKEAKL